MRTGVLILVFGLCGLIATSQSISSAEYFIDITDPGVGNATAISLNGNTGQLTQALSIPTTGLAEGFHNFYIRTKSSSGKWSLYDRTIIYITSFSNTSGPITAVEYFFDADPGEGQGMPLSVPSNNGLLKQSYTIPPTDLAQGVHVFYVRVKDKKGKWSVYDSANITVTAPADDDHDGVPNDLDNCPNTVENAVVDVNGCEVFSLPVTNFKIRSTGASCTDSDNGSIEIEAQENHNYTAILSNGNDAVSKDFTTTLTFDNLSAGNYSVCITVEGESDYENCQDIVITEPEALSVSSKISTRESKATLSLKGGKVYTVLVNQETFTTTDNEITVPLSQVENTLSVVTDKPCQGTFGKTIILSSKTLVYPNPISGGDLTVYLGNGNWKNIDLSLYSEHGTRVMSESQSVIDHKIKVNVDALPQGIYILVLEAMNTSIKYKIIRK